MAHYLWVRSTGEQSDLTTDEHVRVGDVVPGAPPEVVLSVEEGVLYTRSTERLLVELELLASRSPTHDTIELIESAEGHEYTVGDVIRFRSERWLVDHVTTPVDRDNSLRLVCSRVS